MTRGSWVLLVVIGLIVVAVGGALVGSGHGIIGAVLLVIGAPTTGIAFGRCDSSRPPLP